MSVGARRARGGHDEMMTPEDKGGKNKIGFKGGHLAVVYAIPREGGGRKRGIGSALCGPRDLARHTLLPTQASIGYNRRPQVSRLL